VAVRSRESSLADTCGSILGLEAGSVRLRPYTERWAAIADARILELRGRTSLAVHLAYCILAQLNWSIHHPAPTAVDDAVALAHAIMQDLESGQERRSGQRQVVVESKQQPGRATRCEFLAAQLCAIVPAALHAPCGRSTFL
jgi:hypothetical protein